MRISLQVPQGAAHNLWMRPNYIVRVHSRARVHTSVCQLRISGSDGARVGASIQQLAV